MEGASSMTATRSAAALAALALALVALTASRAGAQPFANAKEALVDYSKGNLEPHVSCEQLAKFKDADIVKIEARTIAAAADAPAHCRVSGVLSPEIGFEVNLPARWNRRV